MRSYGDELLGAMGDHQIVAAIFEAYSGRRRNERAGLLLGSSVSKVMGPVISTVHTTLLQVSTELFRPTHQPASIRKPRKPQTLTLNPKPKTPKPYKP